MKILIADDDATQRTLLRATLLQLGYDVELTCDGAQAWQALEHPGAPALAILDWLMPGMTGPDICRKLRARQNGPYVYVILLTGMDELEDLVKGMDAGADDYITKPYKAQELHARLRAGERILELERDLMDAQRALEIRATHDGLTGLLNHVAILERLKQELDRAAREDASLGVILLDLDHFKQVNDGYGHGTGDLVLREAAARIRDAVRPYDPVGRYGGEEFLIVAEGCRPGAAEQIAERVRRAICGGPIAISDESITVTVSAGVSARVGGEDIAVRELIDRADRALYQAKSLGRNRVVVHHGEPAMHDMEGFAALSDRFDYPTR
jgi:diguanylate cyclase (GGDEF)-like protein